MRCAHPAGLANHSGVKVLVAGFAKMGTRSMSRALYQLGFEHSYHSEELLLHVWSPLAEDFWARPEHLDAEVPLAMPAVRHTKTDREVLRQLRPEDLASALARCRADAVAFDGVEELFWPVQQVSPGAKVIVLSWRPFQDTEARMHGFFYELMAYNMLSGYLSSSLTVGPWSGLLSFIDPLVGSPITSLLTTGGPPINQVQGPLVMLWYRANGFRLVVQHWFAGLAQRANHTTQTAMFEKIELVVPEQDRFHFDFSKHGYEDLCVFLKLTNCRRRGKLPRARPVFGELDFPWSFLVCSIVWLLLHLLHWRLFEGILWRLIGLLPQHQAGAPQGKAE